MAWKQVQKYALGFSMPKKQFFFYYWLVGDSSAYQIFPAAEEFIALGDMFRNEGPISLNTDGNYFVTAGEQVGEQEAHP
jgi:hypothetical protein